MNFPRFYRKRNEDINDQVKKREVSFHNEGAKVECVGYHHGRVRKRESKVIREPYTKDSYAKVFKEGSRYSVADALSMKERRCDEVDENVEIVSLEFITDNDEELVKLHKAFVDVVVNLGSTYNIQNIFQTEGYFAVKVTPLGDNVCLLQGQEDGDIEALVKEGVDWLK